MRLSSSMFFVLLIALATSVIAAQSPSPKATVFERARVIIGDGVHPWIDDAAFVVEEGHFTQIGRRGTVKIPRGAVRVNLAGKTVMPAMIDTLTQLSGTQEEISEQLRRRAQHGAVAVMSVSVGAGGPLFQLRDEIMPGAARLLTAGSIGAAADERQAVQDLAAKKVELITIGVGDNEATEKKRPPEIYAAIIEEAHARGLRVLAYVNTLQDMKDLLRAGVDILAGLPRDKLFDRELLLLFRERRDVFLIPNLSDRGVAADFGWLRTTLRDDELSRVPTATDRPELQAVFSMEAQNLGRLAQEKVRIAFGTNSGVPWGHLLEMDDMAAVLLPFDVIVAAGHTAAALLELKDYGAIAPGKVANFLVLDGNPAMDIKQIRRINAVYLHGSKVDRPAAAPRK